MKPSIGVLFVTHNARHHLRKCLPPFLNSPLKPRVAVVNSSSNDGTVELAREMGAEVYIVPRSSFNHGATREWARKQMGCDIIVMATPDAYAVDDGVLECLVDPLLKGDASLSYARQIPHDGADFFEAFPRGFNYPAQGHVRSIEDLPRYGSYLYFCSNTCAAYKNSALDAIGGFRPSLFGEDTVAAAMLLNEGHRIAYAADAVVKHSHKYSLRQEFCRHFDIGLARKGYQKLIAAGGKDACRGRRFAKEMLKEAARIKPLYIPYALCHIGVKWLGYRLGRSSVNAPLWLKKACSSQDFYWDWLEGAKGS